MAEKARCELCDRTFKNEDGLAMHNAAKHGKPLPAKEIEGKKTSGIKNMKGWIIFAVVVIVIVGGIYLMISSIKTLPPTDMSGHVEANPDSHVLRTPMPILIQKHMLEHSDGTGPPGIIINYNCEDYNCEPGLIENLEAFAAQYPSNVYVAPFKGMDAKIALTRLGRIEILDEFDAARINSFIR